MIRRTVKTAYLLLLLSIASAGTASADLLPAPQRPASFPLKRPSQQGVLFAWGWSSSVGYAPFGLHNVVQVAGGDAHWLALLADGTVRTWPLNVWSFGGENRAPRGLKDVVQVAAGQGFSLALRSDGKVVPWGKMRVSVSDPWIKEEKTAFVPGTLPKVVQVAAGRDHALAVTWNGGVVAWGDNSAGQCDDLGLTDVVQVAAGSEHSLALRRNGTVVAWGYETAYPRDDRVLVPSNVQNVAKVAAGAEHSVALLRDGRVLGWGANGNGQAPRDFGVRNAIDISAGDDFTAVTLRSRQVLFFSSDDNDAPPSELGAVLQVAGGRAGLALKESRLVTWGMSGEQNVLGVVPDVSRAVEVVAGDSHILVRMANGEVAAWGGSGNLAALKMPTNLPPARGLAAGADHSAIITREGRVRAWAHQTEESESRVPAGVREIVDLAAGQDHLLALRKDGKVVQWTIDGNLIQSPSFPEKIKKVGVGSGYNFALGRNGDLYQWPSYPGTPNPIPAVVRRGVASFAVNHRVGHVLSIDVSGKLSAFNVYGSQNISRETTVPPGIGKCLDVAVGPLYCLVLQRDGTLRSWGDGSLTDYPFARIGPAPLGLKNVSSIAVGRDFAVALRQALPPKGKP